MNIFPGYKTKVGAALTILGGLVLCAQALLATPADMAKVAEGLASIGIGLGMLGIRFAQD